MTGDLCAVLCGFNGGPPFHKSEQIFYDFFNEFLNIICTAEIHRVPAIDSATTGLRTDLDISVVGRELPITHRF